MGNRVAVIGPAKAGKTTLAERMQSILVTGEYNASGANEYYTVKWEGVKLNLKVYQGSQSWDWDMDSKTKGVIFVINCGLDKTDKKEWAIAAGCLKIALSKMKRGPLLVLANRWDEAKRIGLTFDDVERLMDLQAAKTSQFMAPDVQIAVFKSATLSDDQFDLKEGLQWFLSFFK